MTINVDIECTTAPDEGEYDDDAYLRETDAITNAVASALGVGAGIDNIEEAVVAGLENAGAK